ncbi:hypothetical protein K7432_001721 [Basidiobolus ranarum]|uniref:PH domain-containing protein n=1 Tax=Basidiobolus ranarum TaxID=34480 RepID=A0ABR2X2M5_9FUNG
MSTRLKHPTRLGHEENQSIYPDISTEAAGVKVPDINDAILTFQLLEALREGDRGRVAKVLKSCGNEGGLDKIYPIHLAIGSSGYSMIEFLLNEEFNLNINQPDQNGNTPLHLATKSGRSDIVRLLMNYSDIDDTYLNKDGFQAIDLSNSSEIIQYIEENRQEFVRYINQRVAEYVGRLDFAGLAKLYENNRTRNLMDLNIQDPRTGSTALHEAARLGNVELVIWLLKRGADVFARDRMGKLPIDVARSDRVKGVLKEVPNDPSLHMSEHQPRLSGTLMKWMSFTTGYKRRWFILENGVLSYYKSRHEAENSCRGAINLRYARIWIDPNDLTRFDIVGPGTAKYRLRADHAMEVKRWVLALTKSKQKFEEASAKKNLDKIPDVRRDIRTESSSSSTPEASESSSTGSVREQSHRASSISTQESTYSYSSDEELDLPTTEEYHCSVSSVFNEWERHRDKTEKVYRNCEMDKETEVWLRNSFKMIRKHISDVIRMASEREIYWSKKYRREVRQLDLWTESFKALADENQQLQSVFKNSGGHDVMKKASNVEYRVNPEPSCDVEEEYYDASDSGLTSEMIKALQDFNHNPNHYILRSSSGYPAQFRQILSIPVYHIQEVSLWTVMKGSMGKDLHRINFPIQLHEPLSTLQRFSEQMEYSELLDTAVKHVDSTERLLWVTVFAMSSYASTHKRFRKPFNSLLGETFEYVNRDKGYRYMSEQVCTNPPISASHCESANYRIFSELELKSKFRGKSVDVSAEGISHLYLKLPSYHDDAEHQTKTKKEEHYSWNRVTTKIHNLIMGSVEVENYGEMIIKNHTTNEMCLLTFKPRSLEDEELNIVEGYVASSDSKITWEMYGKWNEFLMVRKMIPNIDLDEDIKPLNQYPLSDFPSDICPCTIPSTSTPVTLLWRNESHQSLISQFMISLNELAIGLIPYLPDTDSRLRQDIRYFENGQIEKSRLENQKLEKRPMPNESKWHPRWFIEDQDRDTRSRIWRFTNDYWIERNAGNLASDE